MDITQQHRLPQHVPVQRRGVATPILHGQYVPRQRPPRVRDPTHPRVRLGGVPNRGRRARRGRVPQGEGEKGGVRRS